MFRQVVAHRWGPDVDEEARAGYRRAMEALRGVPELVALRHGDDARIFEGNHDYVAVMDFADFAAARRYVDSELHQRFVQDHARHVVTARVVIQHEYATDGAIAGLHHVKLPVSDVVRSREWYTRAFGFTGELEFVDDGRLRGVGLRHPETGLRLGLREDAERARALAGFDAVCLALGTRADLDRLLARLDEAGIPHGSPFPGRGGDAVDVPDPDGHVVRVHTHA